MAGSTAFLSTLPARGATRWPAASFCAVSISIHAPREGSDGGQRSCFQRVMPISIHAPREGSDRRASLWDSIQSAFLSTLPARGATREALILDYKAAFLSTLPARGATGRAGLLPVRLLISIHAPREGSDGKCAEK